MPTTLIAHAADWISLAFFVPTVAFIAWLVITQLRERREAREEGPGPGSDR